MNEETNLVIFENNGRLVCGIGYNEGKVEGKVVRVISPNDIADANYRDGWKKLATLVSHQKSGYASLCDCLQGMFGLVAEEARRFGHTESLTEINKQ